MTLHTWGWRPWKKATLFLREQCVATIVLRSGGYLPRLYFAAWWWTWHGDLGKTMYLLFRRRTIFKFVWKDWFYNPNSEQAATCLPNIITLNPTPVLATPAVNSLPDGAWKAFLLNSEARLGSGVPPRPL